MKRIFNNTDKVEQYKDSTTEFGREGNALKRIMENVISLDASY